jgi:Fe-S cluster biogenesis protein NfuA
VVDEMKEEVEEVLETLRPQLMQDGGNVELVDIDDGVVKLRLVGSCSSCSSSTMTLKMGIERALKKAIPMVRCIESVE